MQYIKFPMQYMNITQGVNGSYSHKGLLAIDNAGKDGGRDGAFAPFDCVIKRVWKPSGTVWVQSQKKVKFADGTTDYCVVSFTHDNYTDDLKVGQKIKQCVVFYQEGTQGQATGNHVHIEVARGKFTGNGWHQNEYGGWAINNGIHPTKAFFIDGVEIIDGFGYKWVKMEDLMYKGKTAKFWHDEVVRRGKWIDKISKTVSANGKSQFVKKISNITKEAKSVNKIVDTIKKRGKK